jgi:hypothetical protein
MIGLHPYLVNSYMFAFYNHIRIITSKKLAGGKGEKCPKHCMHIWIKEKRKKREKLALALDWGMAQGVQHLPSKGEILSSIPCTERK